MQALPPNKPPPLSERNHVLVVAALAFLAGCRLAIYLDAGWWLWLLLFMGAALFPLLLKIGRHATLALVLCAFSLGVLHAQAAFSPALPTAGTCELTGYISGEAKIRDEERITFTLCDVRLDGRAQAGQAYCSVYFKQAAPVLYDGAFVRFTGRVYLPEGKSGAPHSDFRLWMLQNGMQFGVTSSKEIVIENTPETAPWKDVAYRVRLSFKAALQKTMGADSRWAMALLLNDREGLAEEENEAFRTLGIAHVMSVSGLHVALMGSLLLLLMGGLRRIHQLPILALFLLCYCGLTGFSAASLRAAVMLLLVFIARMRGRMPDSMTTLATAMLIVLVINPLEAFSASFVLSFSAMVGIVLLLPVFLGICERIHPIRVRGDYAHRSRWRRFLDWMARYFGRPRNILSISLAAQLGVLLPAAMYFHQLPLYGVLINLLIVPYVSVLVPLYAITLALSPIPLVGMWVGTLASAMSRLLLWLVSLLSTLPYASVRIPSAPIAVLFGGALLLVIASRQLSGSFLRRACASILICGLMIVGIYVTRPPSLRYIQLAVGQQDAALLFDGDQTIAIDVGTDGIATLDYLLDEGRDLDALYLTHLHLDHAAGIEALLDAGIKIKQVYVAKNANLQKLDTSSLALLPLLEEYHVPIRELAAGDELRYNDSSIRVLWPNGENARRFQDANDLPLVLSINLNGNTLLSMSDLSGSYENYAAIPCDILKVAHHGSAKSTSESFLRFACPRIALISCSGTSASLPAASTLTRLAQNGVTLYRTDSSGDITITLSGDRLAVTPYKERTSQ